MTSICLFQAEAEQLIDQQSSDEQSTEEPGQRFCCAVCGAHITDARYRTQVNQQHIHTRSNPDNQVFSFGCFSAAAGCQVHGIATDQHSWFGGYRWRYAHCKNCGLQSGWQFVGEQSFYALVLEQLVDCEGD